jgi:hypothetical protein
MTLGQVLVEWAEEWAVQAPDSEAYGLLERVLDGQYDVGSEGTLRVRPGEEVGADSLQSPHAPQATFRVEGGQAYRGGYVANVSETCDGVNPVQLITDVQVAPNQTDDAQLMVRWLENQAERGIKVDKVIADIVVKWT